MIPALLWADSDGQFVRRAGEFLSAVFYLSLVVFAVVPADNIPLPRRITVLSFVGFFLLLTVLPPYLNLLSDALGDIPYLASFVGRFPFHRWTLYYRPLLDRHVRRYWPGGLHYATVSFDDDSGRGEHLILDNTIDPMNVSGLVLHFLPTVLRIEDADRRLELVGFLFEFLEFKVGYRECSGGFNVSRRFLGPLSFPTANKHIEPDLEFTFDDVRAINIYHVPWPEDMDSFDLASIEWSSSKGGDVSHVASYSIDGSGTVVEERFQPATVGET